MIIYPPFIGDTIPAFTTDKIVIPFSQNPAVDINEVTGFELIIKDYISSEYIANLSAAADTISYNSITKSGEVTFVTDSWKPEVKQYYKFQMSYSDGTKNPDTGKLYTAYSTASIGRCIGNGGNIFITDLNSNIVNFSKSVYEGTYTTDICSEPVYSYRFIFKDVTTNEILQDTGDVLHNVDNDIITSQQIRISQHNFKLRYDLQKEHYYELIYSVTTVNNFTISTQAYKIIKSQELPMIFKGELKVQQNTRAKDNGYIEISLISNGESIKGDFILERTNDGIEWNEFTKFHLTKNSDLSQFVWKDWSIEQGVEYTYAIRQYSNTVQSERKQSNSIVAELNICF